MAVINSFPVTLRAIDRRPVAPAIRAAKAAEPQRKLTAAEISLTPKQRAALEWLQSNEGRALLSQMPMRKIGILSLVSLMTRGMLRISVDFTPYGRSVMTRLSEQEQRLEKRALMELRRKYP